MKRLNFSDLVFDKINNQCSKPVEEDTWNIHDTLNIARSPATHLRYQTCSFRQRHRWNQRRKATLTYSVKVTCWCQTEHRVWLLYLGHQNAIATYCHWRLWWSFLRLHRYLPREIYLGKCRSHSQNAVSRGKRVIYHGKSAPCNRTWL